MNAETAVYIHSVRYKYIYTMSGRTTGHNVPRHRHSGMAVIVGGGVVPVGFWSEVESRSHYEGD